MIKKIGNIFSLSQKGKPRYDVCPLEGINLHTDEWEGDTASRLADFNQVTAAKQRAIELNYTDIANSAEQILDKMRGYFPDIQRQQDEYKARRQREKLG